MFCTTNLCSDPTSKPSKTLQSTQHPPSELRGSALSIDGRGAAQFVGKVEKCPKIVIVSSSCTSLTTISAHTSTNVTMPSVALSWPAMSIRGLLRPKDGLRPAWLHGDLRCRFSPSIRDRHRKRLRSLGLADSRPTDLDRLDWPGPPLARPL